MLEPEISGQLHKEDLFRLFALQLRKDFESSGIDVSFTSSLQREFLMLREQIAGVLSGFEHSRPQLLATLLYRVDISEAQLKKYTALQPGLDFNLVVAGLIIKRILQKVILKRTFSK